MVSTTPKWLKRLRKRKQREADAALSIMQWKLEEQKRQIDEQFRPPEDIGRFWRGDGWRPSKWWV